MATPFLKWAGGKAGLMPQLAPLLPIDDEERTYHEPFLGGGSLFFNMAPHACGAHLSDVNAELVTTYLAVQQDVEALIRRLRHLAKKYDACRKSDDEERKALYYAMRDNYNQETLNIVDRAALFIFLNRTCFNGLYRVNKSGEFNVPFGRYKNLTFNETGLREASAALADAHIYYGDYHGVMTQARRDDFVYFDPPYVPLSASSNFTSYTKGGFDPSDQKGLRELFQILDERGCLVMLSNSDTPEIRKLYKGYRITKIKAARSINAKGKGRGAVGEVVIRNAFDSPK